MDVVRELRQLVAAHEREWGERAQHMGLDRFTLRDLEEWADAIETDVVRRNTMYADSYWYLLEYCRMNGNRVDTRVGPAREMRNVALTILPFALPRRQKMRRELGYMELAQFITGAFEESEIAAIAPRVDMSLFGRSAIYGPRVRNVYADQLADVIEELRESANSRRAIITISDPQEHLSEQPCLSSLQFQMRHKTLYTTAYFRSWDLWFGAPHDLIVVSGLAQIVANCVWPSLRVGPISCFVANAHIYEKSLEAASGPALDWHFLVPSFYDLETFREWAEDVRSRAGEEWKSGAMPGLAAEYFPKVPALVPLTAESGE